MSMITFNSVTMRNFLSYGNSPTTFSFDKTGTTLILGENLDDTTSGKTSNGVGKSSIINALVYGVYDKAVSDISKDKLVNNINKKDMEVIVDFTSADGRHCVVRRTRKMKAGAAGNNVYFHIDGVDRTLDSAAHTNELIEQTLGIPYELFVRIVVFSASHVPFLDLPVRSHYAANQTDIVEELFGITILSAKANLLKEQIKDSEGRLVVKQQFIDQLEKEHARRATSISNAERRVATWETQNVASIAAMYEKLSKLDNVDIEGQQELHKQLNVLNTEYRAVSADVKQHDKSLKDLNRKYEKIEDECTHLADDKCPYCLQNFADSKTKITELSIQSEKVYASMIDTNDSLKAAKQRASSLQQQITAVQSKISVNDIDDLISIRDDSLQIKNKIAELEQAPNPFLEPLEELKAVALDPIEYDEVNKLTREVEHQKLLLKLLTKNDSFVRKTILNKNIPYLNSRLQQYMVDLNLPHQVEFTHELTAKISRFGQELDFGNLSAGQRARVNVALSFAFKDVLEKLHCRINVCMLDEILDHGLDSTGVQAAARLVKHIARASNLSMFVVSHRDEVEGMFDNTLTIQMEKGFSSLKIEAQ